MWTSYVELVPDVGFDTNETTVPHIHQCATNADEKNTGKNVQVSKGNFFLNFKPLNCSLGFLW